MEELRRASRSFFPTPIHPWGGTPLYKPYRYVLPQRVWFLHRLGLKTGIDLAQFGLESAFGGATVVYEHICRLIPNE